MSPCSRHSGRSSLRVQGKPVCFESERVSGLAKLAKLDH